MTMAWVTSSALCPAAVKQKLIREWVPEYSLEEVRPPQETPDVHSERATNVTLGMILKEQESLARKTKIICTAGPACWSEEGLGKLLEAGLNVLRLNFSHGDQEGHYAVLERFRMVRAGCGSVGYESVMNVGYKCELWIQIMLCFCCDLL